jgi:hypothetical protein
MKKLINTLLFGLLSLHIHAQPFTTLTEPKLLGFVQNQLFASYPIFGKEEQVKNWMNEAVKDIRFIPNGTLEMPVKGLLCYTFKAIKQTFGGQNEIASFDYKLSRNSYLLVGGSENYTRSLKYLNYVLYFETPETKDKVLKYIWEQLGTIFKEEPNDVDMSNPYYVTTAYAFREGTLNVITSKTAGDANISLQLILDSDLCREAGIDKDWIPQIPTIPMVDNYISTREKNENARTEAAEAVKNGLKAVQITNTPHTRAELSQRLNSLGWYELLLGDFKSAQKTIEQSILINPDNPYPYTNLPPILLGLGQTGEAEKRYREWMTKSFTGGGGFETYRDAFLDDFETFKDAGVFPKEQLANVEKMRAILLAMSPKIENYVRKPVEELMPPLLKESVPTIYEMPQTPTPKRKIETGYDPTFSYKCDNRCLLFNGKDDYLNVTAQPIIDDWCLRSLHQRGIVWWAFSAYFLAWQWDADAD